MYETAELRVPAGAVTVGPHDTTLMALSQQGFFVAPRRPEVQGGPHMVVFRPTQPAARPDGAGAPTRSCWTSPAIQMIVTARTSQPDPVLRNPVSRKRVATADMEAMARDLVSRRDRAVQTSLSAGTVKKYESSGRYLFELCQVLGLTYRTFGALPENGGVSLEEEDRVLELLAIFAVHHPRVAGATHNVGEYGSQVVTGARWDVRQRHHREIGTPTDRNYGLKAVFRSLEKEFPAGVRAPRPPVLQDALRAVLATLDLENPLHRVYAALWTMQWQGVCRCGDLLRRRHLHAEQLGDPFWEAHRGRAVMERITVDGHPDITLAVVVHLAPGKQDPLGKRRLRKFFPVDRRPGALSGGRYYAEMLCRDPLRPGETKEDTPMFRMPGTRAELDYDQAKEAFKHHLRLAGYPELATGLHTLRGGGGSAANDVSGYFVAKTLGHWKSKSCNDYFWSMRRTAEKTMVEMARSDAGELADTSGPSLHRLRR